MKLLKIAALVLFSALLLFSLSCARTDENAITGTVTSISEGDGGEGTIFMIDKGSSAGIQLNQQGWVLEKGDTIATIRVDELKEDTSRAVVLEHTPFKAVTEGLTVHFDANGTILSPEASSPRKPCPDIPGPYVPTVGGNMARTGSYYEKGVPSPVGVLWKYTARAGILTFTPPVADGVIFLGNGWFSSIDSITGDEISHFRQLMEVTKTPTVLNSILYVPDYSRFYTIDARTGIEMWRFEVRPNAPAVADGTVFLVSYDDGILLALDAETGKEKWRSEKAGISLAPAVEGNTVYTASIMDYLWAFDTKTGTVKWKTLFNDDSIRSIMISRYPVIGGEQLYICTPDFLRAVDKETGVERWRFSISNSQYTTPAVACNVVYIFSPGVLNAVNAQTGLEKWRFDLKEIGVEEADIAYDPPIVVDGVVYFGGLDESVYAVDAETGKLLWSYKTEHKTSTPVIVDGVLYVTSGPYLYAIK
jgi:outer membrane protein assembly factor BamB